MFTVVRATALVLALLFLDAATLVAQAARKDAVLLIVRPRVGDTLWLQLDQVVEMSAGPAPADRREGMGSTGTGGKASERMPPARSPVYGPRKSNASTQVTKMHLFAHSVVESSDMSVTTVLATTDSLLMWAGLATDEGSPKSMALPADGRHTRVRVTPDGTMMLNDPPPGALTLGTTLSAMPGMLPTSPIAVGEKWERDIPIPSLPIGGMRADGTLRATFRLDSLTKSGKVAWISMEGTLRRDGSGHELPVGTRVVTAGTIRGQLMVDRVRAWITDAHTVIDVESEVSQSRGMPGSPMLLSIRVTQRVRVR